MGKIAAIRDGFRSGMKYATTGRKNSFTNYTIWRKEFPFWETAELIGMFSLTAAEIGMTCWGTPSFLRDISQNVVSMPVKIIGTASLLYLGCRGLVSGYRTISELASRHRRRRLGRIFQQKTL
jgi:hypothetical protein